MLRKLIKIINMQVKLQIPVRWLDSVIKRHSGQTIAK